MTIFAYSLSLAVIEYQTAILRKDFAAAAELLDNVPQNEKNKVARFLEAQGMTCSMWFNSIDLHMLLLYRTENAGTPSHD
jgi:hypothetical protein